DRRLASGRSRPSSEPSQGRDHHRVNGNHQVPRRGGHWSTGVLEYRGSLVLHCNAVITQEIFCIRKFYAAEYMIPAFPRPYPSSRTYFQSCDYRRRMQANVSMPQHDLVLGLDVGTTNLKCLA